MTENVDSAKIWQKLNLLEQHIINLIIPIQEISEFMRDKNQRNDLINAIRNLSNSPLKINERPFESLRTALGNFEEKLNRVIKEKFDATNYTQAMSEIKYIGKRLLAVENSLKKLEEKGLKNDFQLKIQYNDIEMVEKEEKVKLIHKSKYSVEDILKTLVGNNVSEVVKLGLGLDGNKIHTLIEIANKLGYTRETVSLKFRKALRMLNHSSRVKMIKECDCEILKKAVLRS